MTYNQQYKIFVSSPNDVAAERDIVDEVIAKINDAISDTLGIYLTVEKWEKLPPETTDVEFQERLNEKIKDCHFFLLILYKRYGTVMAGQSYSNTEREINTILDSLSNNKSKKVLSYFKEYTPNSDPGPQELKIIDLKKRLGENPCWVYKEFKKKEDFRISLTHDLYQILVRMKQSSFKIEQLKRFWQLGKLDNQVSPKVLVIYPPVPRDWMDMPGHINIWQRRLLPNLFFEDFKALHKILKNLAMIGIGEYKVYSKYDNPPDFDKSNVIWICLPRQTKGLEILKKRKDARFEMIPRKKNMEPYIRWKNDNGQWIEIKSPLPKYIKLQRPDVDVLEEWDRKMGNIIAKDYAVIARFNRDVPYNETPEMEKLKEYYLAGIHGLGTWGATWFIDRFYGKFKEMDLEDTDTLQMLVEVEFCDGRITNVKDVSQYSTDYFQKQLKVNTIKQTIQEYKEP